MWLAGERVSHGCTGAALDMMTEVEQILATACVANTPLSTYLWRFVAVVNSPDAYALLPSAKYLKFAHQEDCLYLLVTLGIFKTSETIVKTCTVLLNNVYRFMLYKKTIMLKFNVNLTTCSGANTTIPQTVTSEVQRAADSNSSIESQQPVTSEVQRASRQ